MLILYLLSQKDYYIGELTINLHTRSGGILNIVFPYSAIYRLDQSGYIRESGKRTAPDGRRRQYIQITESGRSYLAHLLEIYRRFHTGVSKIIDTGFLPGGLPCSGHGNSCCSIRLPAGNGTGADAGGVPKRPVPVLYFQMDRTNCGTAHCPWLGGIYALCIFPERVSDRHHRPLWMPSSPNDWS